MEKAMLTADQIKFIDSIRLDIRMAKETLEIAMQYHSNISAQLAERRKEWWDNIIKANGFDPEKLHEVHYEGGNVYVMEKEEDIE